MGIVASYFRSPPLIQPKGKDQLLEHLANLDAYNTKHFLLDLLKNDPTARARCILLNDITGGTEKSTAALTDEDVENLYIDVETAICECSAEEIYLEAFIDLMVNRVEEEGGRGMVQTLHKMLWLAWGMNHGKSCFLNSDPRSLPPIHIQERFIRAIEELDAIGKRCGYVWALNEQGKFHLEVLIIKDHLYNRVQHLKYYKSAIIDFEAEDEYEDYC